MCLQPDADLPRAKELPAVGPGERHVLVFLRSVRLFVRGNVPPCEREVRRLVLHIVCREGEFEEGGGIQCGHRLHTETTDEGGLKLEVAAERKPIDLRNLEF